MNATADFLVWAHAPHGLESGDIAEAISWFREVTGRDAKLLVLNPQNECFAKEVTDGVIIDYRRGCLLWEIWMSATSAISIDKAYQPMEHAPNMPPQFLYPTTSPNQGESLGYQNSSLNVNRRGRPRKFLPHDRMKELQRQGLGIKRIARELQAEGIQVSAPTVGRAIARQLELPINT